MNENYDELERDISRLPLPTARAALDTRIEDSLRQIRADQNSPSLARRHVHRSQSTSWRWASLQAIAVICLCVVSFVAGRYSNADLNSQAAHPQPDYRQVAVVKADIEATAAVDFQSLIGDYQTSETILGPAEGLSFSRSSTDGL